MKFMYLIMFIITAYAQDDSSSGECVFFPHSDLFCGQYIYASTMVHIDPNVFNYTEANNRLLELSVNGTNGAGSCRPIREYTFCLSIYPRCNGTTQALVPPCMEDCMEYSDLCDLTRFFVFPDIPDLNRDSLDAMFLLPCSNPYRAFSSVIVDTENCFNFSCYFDDLGTQYSFGQQLNTRDCSQCLCDNGISTGIIVVIAIGIILVIAVVFFMIFICCCVLKKRRHRRPSNSPPDDQTVNHGIKTDSLTAYHGIREDDGRYISYLALITSSGDADFKLTQEIINNTFSKHQLQDFIISKDCLKICELLGAGSFGQVFYGLFTSKNDESVMEVAIKTIKECHSIDDLDLFIAESVVMKDFKHKNILGLVGVYAGIEDEVVKPYIVLPFMVNKDLKNFLQSKRKEVGNDSEALLTVINYSTLVKMCFNICCGMEYLSSIKYVHRDLAARNCMVDKDLTIKVADFGLTRDIYGDDYYRMGRTAKVPIKWMPPESILDKYYDQKTDVWSFGIVCWEVFSLGKQPYPGVESQNILQHIESGNRLHKTALCRDEMYQIMLSCWEMKNNDRPTFTTLVEQLEQHCSDVLESNTSNPYLQLVS